MADRRVEGHEAERRRADPEAKTVQGTVNAHFDAEASYWDGVYRGQTLQGTIYQQRQEAVLAYVQACAPAREARVLEIGSGAGHLTVALAHRGLNVRALDASEAMVATTVENAAAAGRQERVEATVADVHALPFAAGEFPIVVAVGVIPWLHTPAAAVAEMARVLAPGGHLIVTADNRARLTSFTDPRAMLALSPLRRARIALRQRQGRASSRLHYPRTVEAMLRHAGLRVLEHRTVGFGPLSLMGRPLLDEERGVRANWRMQALADRGVPGLRGTGWHYLARAVKP